MPDASFGDCAFRRRNSRWRKITYFWQRRLPRSPTLTPKLEFAAYFWRIVRENCRRAANPTGPPIRDSRPVHLNNVQGIQSTLQLFYWVRLAKGRGGFLAPLKINTGSESEKVSRKI
jgi:hypothetical protein